MAQVYPCFLQALFVGSNRKTGRSSNKGQERYDAEVKKLKDLYDKRDEQKKKAMLEAVEKSNKSYEETMVFLSVWGAGNDYKILKELYPDFDFSLFVIKMRQSRKRDGMGKKS